MAACFAERHITGCATEELKTGRFELEYMGELAFYLEALDRIGSVRMRILALGCVGVLLCRTKDDEVVEYAMSRHISPALVARYENANDSQGPPPE
jgi:YhcG PDDEXK nuclease domain